MDAGAGPWLPDGVGLEEEDLRWVPPHMQPSTSSHAGCSGDRGILSGQPLSGPWIWSRTGGGVQRRARSELGTGMSVGHCDMGRGHIGLALSVHGAWPLFIL